MTRIKESEIMWTIIGNNLRVGVAKGKGVLIEHEDRRIFLDKKRSKKLKLAMLDVFKTSDPESYDKHRRPRHSKLWISPEKYFAFSLFPL